MAHAFRVTSYDDARQDRPPPVHPCPPRQFEPCGTNLGYTGVVTGACSSPTKEVWTWESPHAHWPRSPLLPAGRPRCLQRRRGKPKWSDSGSAGGPSASASAAAANGDLRRAGRRRDRHPHRHRTRPAGGARRERSVTLADASGAAVNGGLRSDGTTWIPATQLKYGTQYTATVTSAGDSAGKKITFTTMAKPGKTVNVSTALSDNKDYGVAIPIVVRFGSSVPTELRASVEKRLIVTSTRRSSAPGTGSTAARCTSARRSTGRPARRSASGWRRVACS